MVRSTGLAIHHTSKVVHRLLALSIGVIVVASGCLASVAWRLAQGPIDLGGGLSDRVRAALVDDTSPVRVSFDGISLAWEGFHEGVDHPLDLRLVDVAITDPAGHRLVTAPRVHLTFSLAGLLLGRVVPRAVEVDHARAAVTREADGALSLGGDAEEGSGPDAGPIDLRQIREQLVRPPSSDHGRSRGLLDQLRRLHFHGAEVTLRDSGTGLTVRAPDLDLDLFRSGTGHVGALLRAPLTVGDQQASLTADANWTGAAEGRLHIELTPFRPAGLGKLPPELSFLAGIDLPVSLAASVGFDPEFKPTRMQADIQLGQGHIQLSQGSIPMRAGTLAVSGTPTEIKIARGHFDLAHAPGARPETVDITGTVFRAANRFSASFTVGLGPLDIADLPALWPVGVGGGGRPWIVEHVTQGMATRGTASFVIEADDALHDVAVTKATGDLDVSNGTFTWIDNVPPIDQTEAHLHLVDPDTLDIHLTSGRQRIQGGAPGLMLRDGQMRITGLSVRDQDTVIRTRIEGPVTSALALLKEPRLHLLSSHPIGLKVAEGDASATLDFQFPLENKLRIDDVRLHADAHLENVRLLDVVGANGLEDGAFDLGIDKDGLKLKGQGSVASVPVTVDGAMDFTPGPATQIVQKIALTGQPDAGQLDAAGLHVADILSGPVPLTVAVVERRGGDGAIAINADLTLATLAVGPLAWSKPSGAAATASASVLLSHDRVVKVDKIAARGDDMLLTGSVELPDGHARTVLFDTIRLGRTRGHGTVHLAPNEPIRLVLQGEQIDLSAKLTEKTAPGDRSGTPSVTTPAWAVDARFDHAILAHSERADDILVKATGGGDAIGLLDVIGTFPAAAGFSVRIEPRGAQRHLLVDARDAGSFLRGIDVIQGMRSGRLTIDGTFGTPFGMHPLTGTATIDDVVVKNSPLLGKLLQAITLYGLVDALRGPGMNFTHVYAPFRYDGAELTLDEAHAYNSSLGLTASGRFNFASGQTSLGGTIVPAYFFNSMLGQLPLVGRLFSPEKGGGVFAARFGVSGRTDDPDISINPVSALTPGFLREIFGVFDRSPDAKDPDAKDRVPAGAAAAAPR